MRRLTWSMIVMGDVVAYYSEDIKAIEECFDNENEMTFDEYGKVYNEAGTYIADVKINKH